MLTQPLRSLVPGLNPGIPRAAAQPKRRREIRECVLLGAVAALCQLLSVAAALYFSGHFNF